MGKTKCWVKKILNREKKCIGFSALTLSGLASEKNNVRAKQNVGYEKVLEQENKCIGFSALTLSGLRLEKIMLGKTKKIVQKIFGPRSALTLSGLASEKNDVRAK